VNVLASSSRVVQRSIRPIATPAIVAWTPLLYISPQITRASGTYTYQPRTPLRSSSQKTARPTAGPAERREVEVLGEEDRDDQDREEVVDDGEREQEGAQGARQGRADDGEDGEREGDVGGGRHGPALRASRRR
jgi:hypothetical protein